MSRISAHFAYGFAPHAGVTQLPLGHPPMVMPLRTRVRFAPSASMMKISRLLSELRRSLAKTIFCPSGEKFGPTSCDAPTGCVSCFCTLPERFLAKMILGRVIGELRLLMYTISPVAETPGSPALGGAGVSCLLFDPSASITRNTLMNPAC